MFTPTDCKDIRVRIFAFMAMTKFLYHLLALVSSVNHGNLILITI